MNSLISKLQSVHPFPARMASAIALEELISIKKSIRVLDPMMGSGTTLVAAKLTNKWGVGFDTDPLALLMSKTWCADFSGEKRAMKRVAYVLETAKNKCKNLRSENSYPDGADEETKRFIDFWFDSNSKKELTALSASIRDISDSNLRNIFWCAFSRMIITKKNGVSLAMDVSHSRPHRTYEHPPESPFDFFTKQVKIIIKRMPFKDADEGKTKKVIIEKCDAREMSLGDKSIDFVITSPPYLNAIDYLRGHKLSLVWMGHKISSLRKLRSGNIGATRKLSIEFMNNAQLQKLCGLRTLETLSGEKLGMLKRYVFDMGKVISEIERVLIKNGKVIFVIGDCNLGDVFISNSKIVEKISKLNGLKLKFLKKRPLPDSSRYLPPPTNKTSGTALQKRMKEEVILAFAKE